MAQVQRHLEDDGLGPCRPNLRQRSKIDAETPVGHAELRKHIIDSGRQALAALGANLRELVGRGLEFRRRGSALLLERTDIESARLGKIELLPGFSAGANDIVQSRAVLLRQ